MILKIMTSHLKLKIVVGNLKCRYENRSKITALNTQARAQVPISNAVTQSLTHSTRLEGSNSE